MNWKREICKAFHTHAPVYEKAAVAQGEIGRRLLERLSYLSMMPTVIVDVGCGTGCLTEQLSTLYPQAQVIGIDYAPGMLQQARNRIDQSLLISPTESTELTTTTGCHYMQADMMLLPLMTESVDFIFANQVVHWAPDAPTFFKEMLRVLKPGGCLFFSTLGPDTFYELTTAWQTIDAYTHVFSFTDMHLTGDQLAAVGFLDPVMDRETLTLEYPSLTALLHSLKVQGVRNMHPQRRRGLMDRKTWRAFEAAYQRQFLTPAGKAPLHYEILYGHAWKGEPKHVDPVNEISIPISQIRRGRR